MYLTISFEEVEAQDTQLLQAPNTPSVAIVRRPMNPIPYTTKHIARTDNRFKYLRLPFEPSAQNIT